MKTVSVKLTVFALALLALHSCREDDIPPIGEPFSQFEGLVAQEWILTQAFLVDEGNPAKPERDLTEFFVDGENATRINFNADSTFSLTPGPGIQLLPLSGEWYFNSYEAPTSILLVRENGEVTEAPLGGPTRIVDQELRINFVKRTCTDDGEEKAVIGYRLVFNRIP